MATITSPTPGTHFSSALTTQSNLNIANATFPISNNTRWQWNLTGAESSANAGSNLQLQAIADDGTTIVATAISINRSTGAVTIQGGGASEYFGDGSVTAPSIANSTNHASGVYFTTNAVNVASNGVRGLQVATATTGVNYLVATPAATGAAVSVSAAGSDTDVGLLLVPKGAGVVALGGSTAANSGLQVPITASAVDFLQVSGSTTGNHLVIALATGTDSNVTLSLQAKGSGAVALGGTTQANSSAQVLTVASAVNFVQVSGAISTGPVLLGATGTDSTVDLLVTPKGAGAIYLTGTSASAYGVKVIQTASTAVGLIVTPAATGASATLAPQANTLILGAGAALATNAISGHVAIPTCAGTPSGTPTGTAIGHAQLIFDTTGVKLWAYKSGVGWVGVVLS